MTTSGAGLGAGAFWAVEEVFAQRANKKDNPQVVACMSQEEGKWIREKRRVMGDDPFQKVGMGENRFEGRCDFAGPLSDGTNSGACAHLQGL
jgi:hypothetical protein